MMTIIITPHAEQRMKEKDNISSQLQFNLPWSMWEDLVIAAQMKRLDIKEIYSNDKDFEKISWIKRIF